MTAPLNRSVPLNGRVGTLHSEGARFRAHRPVSRSWQCPCGTWRGPQTQSLCLSCGRPDEPYRGRWFAAVRPIAPQRHRERRDYWSDLADRRERIELADTVALWACAALTAIGLGLAVYGLTVLAMVAGP